VTRVVTALLAAAALAVAALAVVLVSRSSHAAGGPAGHHPARHADVRVARSRFGRILVDGRGRTLYLFLRDHRGRSACSGGCARVWPPLTVTGAPQAGPGVRAAKLRTVRRGDHARQVVYNGHPLYRMSADVRAGQVTGQAFLGQWFVVSPVGRMVGRRRRTGEGY
jgi:predicted lipoprotein with Yx(FWY)xxD motif